MKKTTLFLAFVICLLSKVFAQSDSLRNAILRYEDPKTEMIEKGRKLIVAKLMENDKQKVRELLDYLVNNVEDKDYLAIYTVEKWLLWYWTGDYEKVIEGVKQYDSAYIAGMHRKIAPRKDLLLTKTTELVRQQRTEIQNQIRFSNNTERSKAFLILNLNYLLFENTDKRITQDTLNKAANAYLLIEQDKQLIAYTRKYIRYQLKAANWGTAFEFFSGYGSFSGSLANDFRYAIPFGVAFDVSYKRMVFYIRDYIGISKTKDSLAFKTGTWAKAAAATVFLPELSVAM